MENKEQIKEIIEYFERKGWCIHDMAPYNKCVIKSSDEVPDDIDEYLDNERDYIRMDYPLNMHTKLMNVYRFMYIEILVPTNTIKLKLVRNVMELRNDINIHNISNITSTDFVEVSRWNDVSDIFKDGQTEYILDDYEEIKEISTKFIYRVILCPIDIAGELDEFNSYRDSLYNKFFQPCSRKKYIEMMISLLNETDKNIHNSTDIRRGH